MTRRRPRPMPLTTAKKAQLVAWARRELQHAPRSQEQERAQLAADWVIYHYARDLHPHYRRTR